MATQDGIDPAGSPCLDSWAEEPNTADAQDGPDWLRTQAEINGFACKWTGWKANMNTLDVRGQWVAFKRSIRAVVVVDVPTMQTATIQPGGTLPFELFAFNPQVWSKAERLRLIAQGLEVLKSELEKCP